MSAATKAQSVIHKLKEVWTRLSDNFQAFWSVTEVQIRLNLLRSTRDMLLERNILGASKGPAEAETDTANRTRAFFYAACPELSDDKISRLASEIFPHLISARVANIEECLRIDKMFVRTTVAAALPKGSPSIGAVEKQMLDTRQKIMYTFLLDVITVFSSANGVLAPAPNEGASARSQNQTRTQQQKPTQKLECEYEQKDMEAELEAEAVPADMADNTISTISAPAHSTATTSRSDLSATSPSTASTEALAPKPPRPPAKAAATPSVTTADTTPASGSVPTVRTPSLSMATPLVTLPSSAVESAHAVSATDLRDTNVEGLRAQWEAHGRAFEEFWRRLTIEKLPDGSAAHASAREEFLRVVRQALLRRVVSGGGGGDECGNGGGDRDRGVADGVLDACAKIGWYGVCVLNIITMAFVDANRHPRQAEGAGEADTNVQQVSTPRARPECKTDEQLLHPEGVLPPLSGAERRQIAAIVPRSGLLATNTSACHSRTKRTMHSCANRIGCHTRTHIQHTHTHTIIHS